jgi:hypothetical protein
METFSQWWKQKSIAFAKGIEVRWNNQYKVWEVVLDGSTVSSFTARSSAEHYADSLKRNGLKKTETVEKKVEKLNKQEIEYVGHLIRDLQKKGKKSSEIISTIQKAVPKLRERWKAERAYWTEAKRQDTEEVAEVSAEIGFEEYKVILSPHACEVCTSKSDSGHKVFKTTDLEKAGFGHVPPFHPNCYCVLVPRK